jgi:hypothetical protein
MTRPSRASSYAESARGGHRADLSSYLTEPSTGDGIDRCGLVARSSQVRQPDPTRWAPRLLDPDTDDTLFQCSGGHHLACHNNAQMMISAKGTRLPCHYSGEQS